MIQKSFQPICIMDHLRFYGEPTTGNTDVTILQPFAKTYQKEINRI